jgi:eukaryotic-like serine/threonine-protein kinase
MSGEVVRWNRVKQVFQAALDRPTEERGRFLDEACRADRPLRAEVDSLLLNLERAGRFAERSPLDAFASATADLGTMGLDAPRAALEPGDRVGSCVILERIGRGGMGDVYRALDTALRRHVAVKVVSEQFASDPVRLARFEREATLIAALNDPNIAAVYSLERTESGRHALILELVEGSTLSERLRDGPLPVEAALHVARQIAQGLEAAHRLDIVHRDLKPANVKLRPDGVVKVLDFGLAKSLAPGEQPAFDTQMIASRAVMGTPAYMSPEQACGLPVDERVDIWAFGCVLYELLTGTRAFEGESVAATLANVIGREPAWERLPPDLPPALVSALHRCLQKDAGERPRTIDEVRPSLAELHAPLRGRGTAPVPGDAASTHRGFSLLRAFGALLTALVTSFLVSIAALVFSQIALGWSYSPNEMAIIFLIVLGITAITLMRRSRVR